eukprot:NODE_548_length_2608_cov_38.207243_g471_i0.p1 GENE.NODE_548_length_2608_cov_38.207243_g471_i0~~NODE_548_length_2608_cov_38.207243_g471_i0.p1  ORF type:complete len:591 (+),score=66.31 NODE_548_length_2608_cov_38.207243_g471_i0:127-1899(+)
MHSPSNDIVHHRSSSCDSSVIPYAGDLGISRQNPLANVSLPGEANRITTNSSSNTLPNREPSQRHNVLNTSNNSWTSGNNNNNHTPDTPSLHVELPILPAPPKPIPPPTWLLSSKSFNLVACGFSIVVITAALASPYPKSIYPIILQLMISIMVCAFNIRLGIMWVSVMDQLQQLVNNRTPRLSSGMPIFREIWNAKEQIRTMHQRLQHYQAYLPTTIYQGGIEQISPVTKVTSSEPTQFTPRNHKHLSARRVGAIHRTVSKLPSSHSFTSTVSHLSSHSSFSASNVSLDSKRCSLCMADWQNFNMLAERAPLQLLLQMHSDYVDTISKVLKGSMATIDRFLGDKIIASWNTAVPQASFVQQACGCAVSLEKAMVEFGGRWALPSGNPPRIRICVVSGEILVGHLGCKSMRSFSLVGTLVNWCHLLNKLSRNMCEGIVIDHSTYHAAKEHYAMHILDHLGPCPPFGQHLDQYVYRLTGPLGNQTEYPDGQEWMYELLQNSDYTHFDQFNKGYKLVCSGYYREGIASLKPYLVGNALDQRVEMVVHNLANYVAEAAKLMIPAGVELTQVLDLLPQRGPEIVKNICKCTMPI